MSPSASAMVAESESLSVRQLPTPGQINLRATAAELADRLHPLGLPFADATNAEARLGSWRSLGLGPNEWLLLGPPEDVAKAIENLTGELADRHASVVDVTDHWQAFAVTGDKSRDLLAALSPLDPALLAPGRCAQTLMAKANVVLFGVDEADGYRVLVRSSFTRYLDAALGDQAALLAGGA